MEGITNGKKRKRTRAETWVKVTINPEEILQSPYDVKTQLTEENNLRATGPTVEDKEVNLYWEMRQKLPHTGKDFTSVGKKQQNRHLTQIQKKSQDALWFAETYGLMPDSLLLKDKNGLLHEINIGETLIGKLTFQTSMYGIALE
ncbi:hypothetical protein OS493_022424 [Desmophyllum pertusum]|uniref:Uncharacterized protein n=1 Tax=Desmophyllum pertusum TaxID=174260 RepID=A0A9W9ZMH6_9CNID|nr:hypothetical protein OS493_022424 [Desmophyllum pertusum]